MTQRQHAGAASGSTFSFEGDHSVLESAIGDASFVERIRELVADERTGRDETLRALLRHGADWLGVEHGHLTRIDPARGTHTIDAVSGPHPAVAVGATHDLSRTYCRQVIAQNATLVLGNAPNEGWEKDPAVEAFGLSTYLGAKVVVDGQLYGTLCFVDRKARAGAPGEAEAAAVTLLARTIGEMLADCPAQPTADQLRTLFEHSPNMINIHDAAGNVIAPNPHLCEKTGYTRDELVGMKVWDLDRDVTPEQARASWADMDPGHRAQWEGTFQRKDGTTFPVEVDLRCLDVEGENRFIATSRDVTARKTIEHELREEHDLLSRILETSPAAIVVLDADGAFVEASGRAEDILGLEKDEVTVRTYNDPDWHIRAPDGGAMPEDELPFARVMATGAPVYDIEHRIEWPDGTQRLLSVSGAPLHAADGTLDGAVFHLDDITEQRAAEQALREERDRFVTLFRNLPTPVVHGTASEYGTLRVQAVNERFEEVFGCEASSVRGEDLQELIVPAEEREDASSIRRQLLEGTLVNREVRRRAADGIRDFQVQVALRREGGRPTEGFAIYTDITERKDRERQLVRRRALLEAQAEAMLDGLLVVDEDQHVVFCNDRFREIWKLPPERINADTTQEQVLLDAGRDLFPDPESFRTEVEYLQEHPHAESRDLVQFTDGRWIDQYSAPILDDEGHSFGRLWVFRDVTQQRHMLERLLEVQEEERRRIDQEIHDGMGGLLTSLQFTIDLARRGAQENGASTEHLDQLEELVSDLSTVSRTISRKLYPSDLSEHGLSEGIASLVNKVKQTYDLDVELYSEIGAEDRFSTLVERTVYWILQEVLTNITRHEAAGPPQVILNKRDERLYLHIFDESAGIDHSPAGEDRRVQLEAIRRRVEWLDGEVRVDSIPDEGVRISIILPVRLPFLASSS